MRKGIVFFLMAALTVSAVMAASVMPELVDGNPKCEDLGPGYVEFKIDPPTSGNYTTPNGTMIEFLNDGTYFNFTSSTAVSAVISKGGSNANVFFYVPPAYEDEGLFSPTNPSGKPAELSHASFCFRQDNPPVTNNLPEFGSAAGLGVSLLAIGGLILYKRKR